MSNNDLQNMLNDQVISFTSQIDTIWAADLYGIYKASRCKSYTADANIVLYLKYKCI